MILCAGNALSDNEQRLNELNVFPVPDGDTGTNMRLTMQAACADMRRNHVSSVSQATDRVASAQLRGARGNSGVITSLLFRGLAKGLKDLETASAAEYACAMQAGVDAAYKAVMKPAEGTILTVSRKAAEAAVSFAKNSADIETMLQTAIEAGNAALAETMEINPVLKKAGVVDAGGAGYMVILEAMLGCLLGVVKPEEHASAAPAPREKADFSSFDDEDIKFGYCTEFIIRKETGKNADLLRAYLGTLGDCVVVVEDDEIIKTHAHVNDPGKALTEALTYGPVLMVKDDNLHEQHTNMAGGAGEADADAEDSIPEPVAAEKPIGVVAVCAGEGLEEMFRSLGCDELVTGGQTMNPSTEDILCAVNATPAETVFVFPNNKNIIMAAEQCIPLTSRRVIVIPSKTIPQGISALMNYDPDGAVEDLQAVFTEALGTVHTCQITYAARNSDFDGHDIKAGEYLALLDGQLIDSCKSKTAMLRKLCKAYEPLNPQFINVFYGADVPEKQAKAAAAAFAAAFPEADVNLVSGGQPVYYYIISIE